MRDPEDWPDPPFVTLKLELPAPPTINHYYGRSRNSRAFYLTKGAKIYRHEVAVLVNNAGVRGRFGRGRIAVRVDLHLSHGGDLDNRLKPLLDALEYAEVFTNDRQIDDLRVVRGHPVVGGRCTVQIWRL